MPRRSLRVAIVGSGLMGEMHASAASHEGATIVAISDVDVVRARQLARRFNAGVMSAQEIFARSDLDAVHICTPPDQHFDLCHQALSAGRSVLCEKPLAPSHDDVQTLLGLASSQGLIVCPVHQFPFQEGVRHVLRNRQRLGSVVHLSSEMCTAGATGLNEDGMHRIALDIVTHPLSLFRAFGAQPLNSVDWKVVVPAQGELVLSGASEDIGLSVVLSTRGRPTANSFRVIGTKATASLELFHGFGVVEPGKVSRLTKATRPFTSSSRTIGAALANGLNRAFAAETAFPGLRSLVGAFYDAVEKKSPSPGPAAEITDIAAARDRIISLASDRSRVPS